MNEKATGAVDFPDFAETYAFAAETYAVAMAHVGQRVNLFAEAVSAGMSKLVVSPGQLETRRLLSAALAESEAHRAEMAALFRSAMARRVTVPSRPGTAERLGLRRP